MCLQGVTSVFVCTRMCVSVLYILRTRLYPYAYLCTLHYVSNCLCVLRREGGKQGRRGAGREKGRKEGARERRSKKERERRKEEGIE